MAIRPFLTLFEKKEKQKQREKIALPVLKEKKKHKPEDQKILKLKAL